MIILENELAQRRRDRAVTRAVEQRSRLAQALASLSLSKGLPDSERRRLARNIGRIAELRGERPKRLLRQAFELWADRDVTQLEVASSRWSKRSRYARLSGEEQRSEPLSADGRHYVALAECLAECAPKAKLSDEQNYTQLMCLLLNHTFFDVAEGALSVDLAGAVDVAKLGAGLARKLTKAVPELPRYFTQVEALGLTHPRSRADGECFEQVSGFDEREFALSGWDGYGAVGHLVADAIYDEFMLIQHEGTGFVACCPKVAIATITYSDHVNAISVSADLAADVSEEEAARAVEQATANGDAMPRSVYVDWRIHLVALPGPSENVRSISFALTLERLEPRAPWPSLQSSKAAHLCDPTLIDLLDLRAWEADPIVSALAEAEARLLLLGGDKAAQVLGLRATPTELLDIATLAQGLPPLSITPHILVPDSFSPLPVTTIAGMMDRNLKFVAEGEGLLSLLARDAQARVQTLVEHEARWREGYESATASFEEGAE